MQCTKEEIKKFGEDNDLSFEVSKCILLCADTMEEAIEEVRNFDTEEEEPASKMETIFL